MSKITLECPHFEWISESKLPKDWEIILNKNFSELSKFYYESIFSDEVARKAHHIVDEQIKHLILSQGLEAILDMGVGDGSRLISIAPENADLYGIEINEVMAKEAEKKALM